jgi:hypothetical protein
MQSSFKPSKIRPLPLDAIDIVLKEWAIAPGMRRHSFLILKFMLQRNSFHVKDFFCSETGQEGPFPERKNTWKDTL